MNELEAIRGMLVGVLDDGKSVVLVDKATNTIVVKVVDFEMYEVLKNLIKSN